MSETRPIIFSGQMVRALLNGRKTQTRRLATSPLRKCKPGDLLWVREAHYVWSAGYKDGSGQLINYRATEPDAPTTWTPSIHMPRLASRLTLEVTGVKTHRLNDISDRGATNDCIAEGVFCLDPSALSDNWKERGFHSIEKCAFADLWNSLHGADAWASNPEVVAITFKVHRRNVDRLELANATEGTCLPRARV